jgi:septum formation protein
MLLSREGYRFEVVPSRAEEKQARPGDAEGTVEENARIKGEWVVARLSEDGRGVDQESVLIAADTLVATEDKVYGKPASLDQARRFIEELGGRVHYVMTGVFLHHFPSGRQALFHDRTRVVLKVLDYEEITALFARVDPLDKAAGYGYQDTPEIVDSMSGSESNVIGLPMERLALELTAICNQ